MADVSYVSTGDTGAKASSPWVVSRLQAIQLPRFDFDRYCRGRASFSADQWIDLLVASVGLDPAKLSRRSKLFQLTRLIPYVERNYNLVELGPKGTGKSHIYSEFSPHGMLVSGGEVTLPTHRPRRLLGRRRLRRIRRAQTRRAQPGRHA